MTQIETKLAKIYEKSKFMDFFSNSRMEFEYVGRYYGL